MKGVTGVNGSQSDAALQAGCHAIMQQVLLHLQQLTSPGSSSTEAAGSSPVSKKVQRAIKTAAANLYELLDALESVMDCASYLQVRQQASKSNKSKSGAAAESRAFFQPGPSFLHHVVVS